MSLNPTNKYQEEKPSSLRAEVVFSILAIVALLFLTLILIWGCRKQDYPTPNRTKYVSATFGWQGTDIDRMTVEIRNKTVKTKFDGKPVGWSLDIDSLKSGDTLTAHILSSGAFVIWTSYLPNSNVKTDTIRQTSFYKEYLIR